MGAVAIILVSALLSRLRPLAFLAVLGAHSIVVYLAFFFPMAVSRILLLKFAPFLDIGTVSALVTVIAVAAPMVLYWLIRRFNFGHFLFERPQWARIDRETVSGQSVSPAASRSSVQPAE